MFGWIYQGFYYGCHAHGKTGKQKTCTQIIGSTSVLLYKVTGIVFFLYMYCGKLVRKNTARETSRFLSCVR